MKTSNVLVQGQEHWTSKDGVKLFLWNKKRALNTTYQGTILFIHGSSWCSQPTFDFHLEGRPWSSVMDFFAAKGYDTWCLDNEGYGRSDKSRNINCGVENGAQDIVAATDYILQHDQLEKVLLYGISSGALKSALFTQWHPERVSRLALDAFVWTGEGSPTLVERRKMLPNLVGVNRRPYNREMIQSVFDRDRPGTADQKMLDAFIIASLAFDDSVPTGTYIDMCTKLPLIDPLKVLVPTIIMRSEFDGIAGVDDLIEFFRRLPNPDKHFAMMPGAAHASFQTTNYLLVYDVLNSFFGQTPAEFLAQ
jgi:pimeloyl-ACP methyl ester carboxylesterase